jgi:molybdate transport system ATP-binding protein
MVCLQDISITKSGKKLFNNLNLTLTPGEHYLITGMNGSGKTILLELIAGILHPSRGTITYDFIKSITWEERYWERKKKIQFIPTHALQQFLGNVDNLFYQQRYYGNTDENVLLVKDILGETGIGKIAALNAPQGLSINHLLNIEVSRLSNGQLKKVLLLQCLANGKPEMLLLDYPFEGLDEGSREDLNNFIDLLVRTYAIQIVLVDQDHHLPKVISKKITLDNFQVLVVEDVISNEIPEPIPKAPRPVRVENNASRPIVIMKNLKIQYGETIIINDFNWTVRQGDRWALIGKNGSGKTTLFSLIFADHPMAYAQEIYLFGKRRGTGESIWDIKKRISYLGPELINYVNPKNCLLTGNEYIRSVTDKLSEKRLNDLILYFKMTQFIDKPVKHFSSGQLQLMLMIGAFLEEKELLLLDEPFQFLDSTNKELMHNYLQLHLHKDTTLILITHYQTDITAWTQLTKFIG